MTSSKFFGQLLFVQILIAVSLTGCTAKNTKPHSATLPKHPNIEQTSAPIKSVEVHPQQAAIDSLLMDADAALFENRWLNPINDNAFDRYKSVLLMDPNNEHAKMGLRMIAERYLDLARRSATKGDFTNAQIWLKTALSIDHGPEVQAAADGLKQQVLNVEPRQNQQPGEAEVVLDSRQIQNKDPQLFQQLSSIAQKAKQADQYVLIVARNDAEGRWIYQQLRASVPGYLVRGDIRLGSPTRIKLVNSLE